MVEKVIIALEAAAVAAEGWADKAKAKCFESYICPETGFL